MQIENKTYSRLMTDYLRCTTVYLDKLRYPALMNKQLERYDLDTVCAFELYQMKKHMVDGDCLDFKNFIPK